MEWIFDPVPPSGAIAGGSATQYVFDQDIDTFVREVLQNSHDQRLPNVGQAEVDFDLIQLTGEHRADFLQGMGWDELRLHLEGVVSNTIEGQRIQRELDQVDESAELRLLRIHDRGTKGLVGGEDENGSNFKALCRNVLDTSEEDNSRGGSHGLGKAVLWAFSGVSTVLFSSRLDDSDPEDKDRLRFFGSSELPYHTANGDQWSGRGWIGEPAPPPNGTGKRAVSVWDDEAKVASQSVWLTRNSPDPGTSILIVDLDEPTQEEDRPLNAIATDIIESSSKWFWPAILRETLKVRVREFHNEDLILDEEVTLAEDILPFAEAIEADDLQDNADSHGAVTERLIDFTIPKQRDLQEDARLVGTKLRIRATAPDESDELAGKVARIRGAGMVVDYWDNPQIRSLETPCHVVLMAGEAAETNAENDAAMERFLRACEPPAHNKWTHTTNRQRNSYERGAAAELDRWQRNISQAVVAAASSQPDPGHKGPEKLRRMFPLGGPSGGGGGGHAFETDIISGTFQDSQWNVDVDLWRRTGQEAWSAIVELYLDGESGRGERIDIDQVTTTPEVEWELTEGRLALPVISTSRVNVKLQSSHVLSQLGPRTRLRLDARCKVEAGPAT